MAFSGVRIDCVWRLIPTAAGMLGRSVRANELGEGMEARDIYITEQDLTRLKELLQVGIGSAERDRELLDSLRSELDRAHIVEPTPQDAVTSAPLSASKIWNEEGALQ